jgi:PucR C-terminal helix-turn-helix domain/GGDEF-like domain
VAVSVADSLDRARAQLHERMQARRPEMAQAILARVYGVSDTSRVADPEYVEGLRAAVSAALDYGLAGIGRGVEGAPAIPVALLAQARMAARTEISLDTVLRRYFAGYAVLGDFLLEEAAQGDLMRGAALKSLLRTQAALLDRLVAAVSSEYVREAESRLRSSEERRAERVRRLLAGELLDASELDYDLSAHHIGLIAAGKGAEEAIHDIASSFDRRLLLVRHSEETIWAWLGGRRRLDPSELDRLSARAWPAQVRLAIGEASRGLPGWRLTHQQALAALPVAVRGPKSLVRYADVALQASMLRDDLLTASLHQLYLVPLSGERDGGADLRETLRAYLAAERNVSSTAAALGVSRRTVGNRLRAVEDRIGRPLGTVLTDIEAALRLDELAEVPRRGAAARR